MIHWLRARNVALLKDVFLELGEGLNVVTGETGVGKSVLLEAFALILGGRGRAQLVGPAADRAVVEAGFAVPEKGHPDRERLTGLGDEMGFSAADDDLVIRRELRAGPAHRSVSNRITVNGTAVPVGALRAVGAALAEVYSQGEYLALLQPGAARETVDAAGGHADLRRQVAGAFRALRVAEQERDALEETLRASAMQRAEMERALGDIERAAPQPGEIEALLEERRTLGQAEHLVGRLESAYQSLYGSDTAVVAQLAAALRALDDAATVDSGTARVLEGRPDLLVEVEDLAAAVRDRRDAVRAAPERLHEIEDRLVTLRGLERRHAGGTGGADALLQRAAEIRNRLGALSDQAEERRRAVDAAEAGASRYRDLAAALRAARKTAAAGLAERVQKELVGLGIPRARFAIGIDPLREESVSRTVCGTGHFTEHGLDRIEFLFSASPEVAPAPVGEVASGGESSRFFLALKTAGAREGGVPTLIFDEADTGTSGRIADAVGRRLRRLSASHQVVSVTHLPQVAALGRSHLAVEKLESGDAVRVRSLDDGARIEEIARMLAGPEITDSARQHASELLAGADAPSSGGGNTGPAPAPAGR